MTDHNQTEGMCSSSDGHQKIGSKLAELLIDPNLVAANISYNRNFSQAIVSLMKRDQGDPDVFILEKLKLLMDSGDEVKREDLIANCFDCGSHTSEALAYYYMMVAGEK